MEELEFLASRCNIVCPVARRGWLATWTSVCLAHVLSFLRNLLFKLLDFLVFLIDHFLISSDLVLNLTRGWVGRMVESFLAIDLILSTTRVVNIRSWSFLELLSGCSLFREVLGSFNLDCALSFKVCVGLWSSRRATFFLHLDRQLEGVHHWFLEQGVEVRKLTCL